MFALRTLSALWDWLGFLIDLGEAAGKVRAARTPPPRAHGWGVVPLASCPGQLLACPCGRHLNTGEPACDGCGRPAPWG